MANIKTRLNTSILYKKTDWPYQHDSMIPNTSSNYYGPDNERLHERNKKYQDSSWIYNNKEINYNFNSLGLRMSNEVDLTKDLIYFSGTSYTLGIGVDEKDRYTDILSKELGTPMLSYAGPTYSTKLQVISFFNYVNLYGAPKSACFEFPPAHGYTFFTDHFALTFTGSHRPKCNYVEPYELLERTEFLQNEAEIYVNMLEVFCKTNNIPLTMFSYFPTTLPIIRINIDLLGIEDNNEKFARDICKQNGTISGHPGIGVHKHTADVLKDRLL